MVGVVACDRIDGSMRLLPSSDSECRGRDADGECRGRDTDGERILKSRAVDSRSWWKVIPRLFLR